MISKKTMQINIKTIKTITYKLDDIEIGVAIMKYLNITDEEKPDIKFDCSMHEFLRGVTVTITKTEETNESE